MWGAGDEASQLESNDVTSLCLSFLTGMIMAPTLPLSWSLEPQPQGNRTDMSHHLHQGSGYKLACWIPRSPLIVQYHTLPLEGLAQQPLTAFCASCWVPRAGRSGRIPSVGMG